MIGGFKSLAEDDICPSSQTLPKSTNAHARSPLQLPAYVASIGRYCCRQLPETIVGELHHLGITVPLHLEAQWSQYTAEVLAGP